MRFQVDLNWDDKHVLPERVYPDLEFLFSRMTLRTLEAVASRRGEVILDLGCGRALDAAELARSGATVIGLEPSATMLQHARDFIKDGRVILIRGIGEFLPIKSGSLTKVVCKGALDHFADPDLALREVSRVLTPGGRLIISLANFDSLGFKLARLAYRIKHVLARSQPEGRKIWEPPPDHTIRFNYSLLRKTVSRHLTVEKTFGVSLLFGIPWWGQLLNRLPRRVSRGLLKALDLIAYKIPQLSDVVVVKAVKRASGHR